MMVWMRRISVARSLASSITVLPSALVWRIGRLDSNVVFARCARVQLSARAAARLASCAFSLAASDALASAFLASSALSVPLVGAVLGMAAVSAGAVSAETGAGAIWPCGCFKMRAAGTSIGGGRSLKTLRPSLSNHCHCATTPKDQVHARAKRKILCIFMFASVAGHAVGKREARRGYNRFFGAFTCAFSEKR